VLDGAEPARQSFELHLLISSIAERFSAAAASKGIVLDVKTARSVPAVALGDEGGIGQALSELLDNAVKFTDTGEIVASVTCEGPSGGRTLMHVELSDTGRGISHETLQLLFERSGSLDGGLRTSQRLVELMDGRFGCSSEVGVGTTVWFAVPLDLIDA
jgi:signal transduction histidine kinase